MNKRGFACVGLQNPKCNFNIGASLRAVGAYNADLIVVAGKRYRVSGTDTAKQHKHTPLLLVSNLKDVIPYDCVPVAVDLVKNARTLMEYQHPERAFYIFGPEDGTLGKDVLSFC